jgi:menaquinone-dependent protoporphyrinogen IX oxidase
MKKLLIAYDSGYGSTGKVAEVIKKTLVDSKLQVVATSIDTAKIDAYDYVLVGSPIRLGRCTTNVKNFLKKNKIELAQLPVGLFFTCMSVTKNEQIWDFPLFTDPSFQANNKTYKKMSFMERNHTSSYYIKQLKKSIPNINPFTIAFFKGDLNSKKMILPHRFIMFIAKTYLPDIKEGEFVNPKVVQEWSMNLKFE